jgi:hypothetical protein
VATEETPAAWLVVVVVAVAVAVVRDVMGVGVRRWRHRGWGRC